MLNTAEISTTWTSLLDSINWSHIVLSAIIILIAVILWRLFRAAYSRYAARRAENRKLNSDIDAMSSVSYGLIKTLAVVCVALIILQINGVNVSGMVAGLGIASAIVGLAFQDLLRDIIMGIRIVSDNFFEIGDVISYGGVDGQVVSYTIRATKIRDVDTGNIYTICNRNITEVKKLSHLIRINVPLSYKEDPRRIHMVLGRAAERIAEIEGVEQCDYMGTQSFEDSSTLYRIHLYAPPEDKWRYWREALMLIQDALEQEDIHIPFPQLDVHTFPEA